MGRLPDTFAGRVITARTPYTLAVSTPSVDGTNVFPCMVQIAHNVDRAFEIHRMLPRPVSSNIDSLRLLKNYNMQVTDYTRQQPLLKIPALIASLLKSDIDATWEFAEPIYLERSEGWTFDIELLTGAGIPGAAPLEISLQGYLVNTAPATNGR